MVYQSFEELEIWKLSFRLALEVCREFESSRHFALKDQIQRSCISIPSNIAEGSESDSRLDFIRFLRIAKGSAAELRTQLHIARGLDLVAEDSFLRFTTETKEIAAMTQGLIRSLAARGVT